MKRRKVWIDCDPGHDDVMALLITLAHPEIFELLGLTTVCGNNLAERVTENLLHVLEWIGRSDVPAARGAVKPLQRDPEPQAAHGYNGLEGFEFPPLHTAPVSLDGVSYLHTCLQASPEPVTIMALAPLTNLALLIEQHPEDLPKIAEIVLMGGALTGGNILPHAEFNIYADPEAAAAVFACPVKITVLPLEGCAYCTVGEAEIAQLKAGHGKVEQMAGALLDFFAEYGRHHGMQAFTVFDAGVPYYLLHPERFALKTGRISIVCSGQTTRGQTVFTEDPAGAVKVLLQTDPRLFARELMNSIHTVSEKEKENEAHGS